MLFKIKKELLAKLNGLDDRFEKEMRESNKRLDQVSKALDKAYNKIASLEENNVKLMEELSDARDRIISLERKAEVKSLYKRPGTASDNKDHQWNSTHFASGDNQLIHLLFIIAPFYMNNFKYSRGFRCYRMGQAEIIFNAPFVRRGTFVRPQPSVG